LVGRLGWLISRREALLREAASFGHGQQVQPRHHGKHHPTARGIEEAAQGRAKNRTNLEGRGRGSDGARKFLAVHRLRQHGRHRGAGKRPGGAQQEQKQIGRSCRPSPGGRPGIPGGEQSQCEGLQEKREAKDPAPVEAVRRVPGDQNQTHIGQELHQPDVGEAHRTMGRRVDIPAEGHAQHLRTQLIGGPNGHEAAKRRPLAQPVEQPGFAPRIPGQRCPRQASGGGPSGFVSSRLRPMGAAGDLRGGRFGSRVASHGKPCYMTDWWSVNNQKTEFRCPAPGRDRMPRPQETAMKKRCLWFLLPLVCAVRAIAQDPGAALAGLAQTEDYVLKRASSYDRSGGNADSRQIAAGRRSLCSMKPAPASSVTSGVPSPAATRTT
jgi:hypothetical protein